MRIIENHEHECVLLNLQLGDITEDHPTRVLGSDEFLRGLDNSGNE